MKRYPAYDPPEYVDWQPDVDVQAAFAERVRDNQVQGWVRVGEVTAELHRKLYAGLLRARLMDVQLYRWVKNGVISKAWLATGEEATTVGAIHALEEEDVVGPMIRNASACTERGMPLTSMFSAYLASADNPAGGRDLHTGDLDIGVITPISHVAALVPVTAGAALAFKLDDSDRVALTWTGDGSTRCGECHEGLALAASQRVPAIFVVQDNGVALGTRTEAHSPGTWEGLAASHGMAMLEVDGNNVLDVWAATRRARAMCSEGKGPVLMVAKTFRMGGHATHDVREARKIVEQETFEAWGKRDPIGCYESWLTEQSIMTANELEEIETGILAEVDSAAESALKRQSDFPVDPSRVESGVFAA